MEAKTVSDKTKAAQRRFFEAIQVLISLHKTAGLQTFCRDYNLHMAKYSTLRTQIRHPEKTSRYKLIDIDAYIILVEDFNVSGEWLLTGKGKMFRKI